MIWVLQAPTNAAILIGLAFAMSSTAIVMATLGERGELASEHGRTSFSILMAQDLWVVIVIALVPILAHTTGKNPPAPVWEKPLLVIGVLAGILLVGRWLLPGALGYCARRRQMDVFGLLLFLSVIFVAWSVEKVGISMTLGAFLLGMLLSASDLRYQIEATISPFKQTLMGLFFIAVGISIDIAALIEDWSTLLLQVPILLLIKGTALIMLALAFGVSRAAAIRTGFYLSQVGEFAFVLLGAATVSGLLTSDGHTLAMLVVAVSMIATPLMIKAGAALADKLSAPPGQATPMAAPEIRGHVVIIGYDEVGQLMELMLAQANIPTLVVEREILVVERARRLARGGMMLRNLGVTEDDVNALISRLRNDDYAAVRVAYEMTGGKKPSD